MIQNLITACLLTVSIGNTAIINHESKKTDEINNVETQEIDYKLTSKKQYTDRREINTFIIERNFYYFEGQQTLDTGTYEIQALIFTTRTEATVIQNQIAVNTYFKIKKTNQEQPNSPITLNLNNILTFNQNASITYKTQTSIFNNPNYDQMLDIDYILDNDIGELTPEMTPDSTVETPYVANYGYTLETNETNTIQYTPLNDGYYRYAVEQKYLILYSNALTPYLQQETANLKYIINKPETEIIDLPGVMFYILGMPFAFYSQAFNLTLFPGTQYAINVSNLIFAVITALIVIFIIRKFIGK